MKQAVLLGLCAMEAVALIDLDDTQLDRSRWSCGNCNYVDSGSRRRCNTGNGADSYPFSYLSSNLSNAAGDINPTTADTITEAENTTDGYTGATAATVAEMRTLINARTANLWSTMFCTSYLDQYNYTAFSSASQVDESGGAACVRGLSAASIIEADNAARDSYNEFGTTNGYASSYAVSKGNNLTQEQRDYGVDGEGDVPADWCGVYMRQMLCHIAFPQVLKTASDITLSRDSNSGIDEARGSLRVVDTDTCTDMFHVCSRREPSSDEVKGSFVMSILNNARGLKIEGDADELEGELKNDRFCDVWEKGYGLAQAGTGIGEDDNEEYTISFSSSSTVTASLAAMALVFVAALF